MAGSLVPNVTTSVDTQGAFKNMLAANQALREAVAAPGDKLGRYLDKQETDRKQKILDAQKAEDRKYLLDQRARAVAAQDKALADTAATEKFNKAMLTADTFAKSGILTDAYSTEKGKGKLRDMALTTTPGTAEDHDSWTFGDSGEKEYHKIGKVDKQKMTDQLALSSKADVVATSPEFQETRYEKGRRLAGDLGSAPAAVVQRLSLLEAQDVKARDDKKAESSKLLDRVEEVKKEREKALGNAAKAATKNRKEDHKAYNYFSATGKPQSKKLSEAELIAAAKVISGESTWLGLGASDKVDLVKAMRSTDVINKMAEAELPRSAQKRLLEASIAKVRKGDKLNEIDPSDWKDAFAEELEAAGNGGYSKKYNPTVEEQYYNDLAASYDSKITGLMGKYDKSSMTPRELLGVQLVDEFGNGAGPVAGLKTAAETAAPEVQKEVVKQKEEMSSTAKKIEVPEVKEYVAGDPTKFKVVNPGVNGKGSVVEYPSGFMVVGGTRSDAQLKGLVKQGKTIISMDYNAAESSEARGTEVIIPDDASDVTKKAAENFNVAVAEYMASNGYADYPVRGVKTRSQNGRGVKGIVHVEPFFNKDAKAMEIIKKDPKAFAEIYVKAFGGNPNMVLAAAHGVDKDRGAVSETFGTETDYGLTMIAALAGSQNNSSGGNYMGPRTVDGTNTVKNALSAVMDKGKTLLGEFEQSQYLNSAVTDRTLNLLSTKPNSLTKSDKEWILGLNQFPEGKALIDEALAAQADNSNLFQNPVTPSRSANIESQNSILKSIKDARVRKAFMKDPASILNADIPEEIKDRYRLLQAAQRNGLPLK